ncbi:MAG: hypothetical protein ABWX56_04035 [Mycetocola sp.]
MSAAEKPEDGTTPRRRSTRIAIAVSIVVTILGLVLVVGLVNKWFVPGGPTDRTAAGSSSSTPTPGSTPSPSVSPSAPLTIPTPTPEPIGDEPEAVDAADTALDGLVEATNQVLQRADGTVTGAETVATGFVLGELQALAAERKELGYKQVGDAKVTEVTVASVDLAADPPTMVLNVCVDVSDVDVLDENGKSLKDRLYNPGRPVLHTYGAQHIDGLWKLATHDIPDNGECS